MKGGWKDNTGCPFTIGIPTNKMFQQLMKGRTEFSGQVKKYVGIIFEKHLKFAMLKTYILPKYYKSSTSDEHLIGRQHCNSEFMLITHRAFRLTRNFRTVPWLGAYGRCYKEKKRHISTNMTLSLFFCTPSGIRTLDPLIKSQLLYQLS